MVTIRLILCNFSGGTFNHVLKASVSFVRISLPGMEVMCVYGSRRICNASRQSIPRSFLGFLLQIHKYPATEKTRTR